MRAGDFSEILTTQQIGTDALGRPIFRGQIFDPTTSRTVSGQLVRDAFPGNIIPQGRFSTVSKNSLPQIPLPELAGQRNNIFRKQRPFSNLDLFGVKIDHVINSAHKINTYFNYNKRPRTNNFHLGSDFTLAANPLQLQTVNGRIVRIAEDWAISSTKVNSFRFGFNRVGNDNNSFYVHEGWPTTIGLKGVPDTHFPVLDFNTNYGIALQQLGRDTCGFGANGSWVIKDDFTWIRGKHTFQMGGEFRRYYYNERNCGGESGRFNFTLNSTRHPQFANTGHSVASFMLGAANTASRNVYAGQPTFLTNYPGFYFQDEIKLTPTLTLTAGIRWEIPRPRYEKHNFTSGFDPNEPNPGADGFRGALVFLEDKGLTSFQQNYYREFAPSFGVAWAFTPKTVLRGGYSLTYSPPIANGFGFPEINGQTATISLSRSRAPNAFDPVLYWDSGFPSLGVQLPVKDPTLNNDGDISYTEPGSLKQPYYQHFNLSLQRELPWQTSIELGYVGTKGTRLPLGTLRNFFNMLDSRFLSLGDTLLDDISDHPEIRKPYPSFEGTVQQALRPFPQYQGVSITGYNQGSSTFHSGQLQVRKRPTKGGLGYIVAYTFSKTLTDSLSNIGGYIGYNFQDFYNRRSERALASFSSPHDLKITTIWEIPVGKGRHFLNKGGVTDKVLGGWTITAIQNYRSGDALAFTDSSLDPGIGAIFGEGLRPDRVSDVDPYLKSSGYNIANGSTWVNPSAFAHVPSTPGGVPRRLGNAPRFVEIYGPWTPSETVGFLKKIPITETVEFEMRADVTNIFNRTYRNNPDLDLGSATFGRILSVFGRRTWQMSGRIRF